jgi:hypothetical protein
MAGMAYRKHSSPEELAARIDAYATAIVERIVKRLRENPGGPLHVYLGDAHTDASHTLLALAVFSRLQKHEVSIAAGLEIPLNISALTCRRYNFPIAEKNHSGKRSDTDMHCIMGYYPSDYAPLTNKVLLNYLIREKIPAGMTDAADTFSGNYLDANDPVTAEKLENLIEHAPDFVRNDSEIGVCVRNRVTKRLGCELLENTQAEVVVQIIGAGHIMAIETPHERIGPEYSLAGLHLEDNSPFLAVPLYTMPGTSSKSPTQDVRQAGDSIMHGLNLEGPHFESGKTSLQEEGEWLEEMMDLLGLDLSLLYTVNRQVKESKKIFQRCFAPVESSAPRLDSLS